MNPNPVFLGCALFYMFTATALAQRAAVDDDFYGVEDTPLVIPAPGVLANDTLEAGDVCVLISQPLNGTLALDKMGRVEYSPNSNFFGVDQFQYQILPTWEPLFETNGLDHLLISPNWTQDSTVFAVNSQYAFRSSDRGVNWTHINFPEWGAMVLDPNYAYGTSRQGAFFAGSSGAVYRSVDSGETWFLLISPSNLDFSIVLSSGFDQDQTMYLGGVSGLFQSTNKGLTLTEVRTPFPTMRKEISALKLSPSFPQDRTLFAGSYSYGLAKSMDSGQTWTWVNLGLPPFNATGPVITDVVLSPSFFSDQTVYVATYHGQNSFFRSTNGGESWQRVFEGWSLVVSPDFAHDQIVIGLMNDKFMISRDGGDTWRATHQPLAEQLAVTGLSFSPNFAHDRSIYSVVDDGVWTTTIPTIEISATCRINVSPVVNDPPAPKPDFFYLYQGGVFNAEAPGVLANDFNEGENRNLELAVAPEFGVLVLNQDGSFSYTPGPQFSSDHFVYRLSDSLGSVECSVSLSWNSPPQAQPDYYETGENVPLRVSAPGLLGNDTDPENHPFYADLAGSAENGIALVDGYGGFEYTPSPGSTGIDSFIYEAADFLSGSVQQTVTINVIANDPPVAVPDLYVTCWKLDVSAPGVLGNDYDPDNEEVALGTYTQPTNGKVTISLDGGFSYVANSGFQGVDPFQYVIEDRWGVTSTGTVEVTVVPSLAPTPQPDVYSMARHQPLLVVDAPGVLANDSDPEGATLNVVSWTQPPQGQLTMNRNGGFEYHAADGFVATDSFSYQVIDPCGATAWTDVIIEFPMPIFHEKVYEFSNTNLEPLYPEALAVSRNNLAVGLIDPRLVVHTNFMSRTFDQLLLMERQGPNGSDWGNPVLLLPDPATPEFTVGHGLALDGDRLLIGAWALADDYFLPPMRGAALLYERSVGTSNSVWTKSKVLLPPQSPYRNRFGYSVALHGDIIVVGAPDHPGDESAPDTTGSVFVFERNEGGENNWGLVAQLRPSNPRYQGYFGAAVAASGDLIAVGEPGEIFGMLHFNPSAVYLFQRDNASPSSWVEVARLEPSGGTIGACFGQVLALHGTELVVGAPRWQNTGAAYVFQKVEPDNSWTEFQKLMAAGGSLGTRYGASLGLSGDHLAVGMPYEIENGLVFLYRWDPVGGTNWTQMELIPQGNISGFFGKTLALSGENLVVAATAYYDFVYPREPPAPIPGYHYAPIIAYDIIDPSPTPAGQNVFAELVDTATGERSVNLTFDQVDVAGESSVSSLPFSESPAQLPSGFQLGEPSTLFEIETTASFVGNVQVCISYSGIQFTNENSLRLLHYENSQWIDVTTSLDTLAKTICGEVSSLSPFVVAAKVSSNGRPTVGAVSGGGWFDSPPGSSVQVGSGGKADFAFHARYLPNSSVLNGSVEFQFKNGDLKFKSTSLDRLVTRGDQAQVHGFGAVNGTAGFKFRLIAVDAKSAGEGSDRIRLQIWDPAGNLFYDSQPGLPLNAPLDANAALSGGSIVIHPR